ncbi:MAG TPA: hypothetical protein VN026_15650 [Bacteroidia bacterium]|jgi:hypothetical protein|nr:hypothetical protein [Bacteroidia bacterium]
MKLKIYIFVFLSLAVFGNSYAQEKMILKSGKKINCKIISVNPTTIDYKDTTASSNVFTLEKTEILMAELKNGDLYVFGNETQNTRTGFSGKIARAEERKAAIREKEKKFKDNIIGFQPLDVFTFGRITFSYERLFMDKRMGVAVPVSLSFDPRILTPGSKADTIVSNTRDKVRHNTGIISGLDLNYYYETKGYSKFFFGPRFRYGTDVYLYNVTGYTIQFQNGFLLCSSNGKWASTFSVGFGFARIIASPLGGTFNTRQSYPWGSFTFRLGLRK